jgi:O-antigen ligase
MGVILSAILVVILEMSENFKFPFVNKNHFAGYVEMAIPLTMGYFLGITSRPKKIILASVAVIMITALFLAASRAGILCFAASLIFMAFALRLRRASKGKAAFIYALVFIALIFAVVMGIEPVLERFKTIAGELFSRESRLFMWADTLRIIKDFPLLGSGLGTFRDIYPAYRTLTVQEPVFYAHSDFLQLVCETGLLGLGLVLWFLFIFYKEVFSLWLGRHHPFAKGITLGGLTGILAILLHSFFDFGLQIPANALLLTVIIVLVYKSASLDFEDNDSTEKNRNYS